MGSIYETQERCARWWYCCFDQGILPSEVFTYPKCAESFLAMLWVVEGLVTQLYAPQLKTHDDGMRQPEC